MDDELKRHIAELEGKVRELEAIVVYGCSDLHCPDPWMGFAKDAKRVNGVPVCDFCGDEMAVMTAERLLADTSKIEERNKELEAKWASVPWYAIEVACNTATEALGLPSAMIGVAQRWHDANAPRLDQSHAPKEPQP